MLAPKWHSPWAISAYVLAAILITPLVAIALQSLVVETEIFSHLFDTVLFDYIGNTLLLITLVVLLCLLIGVPLAYLLANYQFSGARFFNWGLLLPLAMPSYVMAYIYTDWFEYAGPVQRFLRQLFDWQNKADYYFFDIRTLGGAAFVLALVLFPYVFLIVKTAFKEQSQSLSHAASMLGKSRRQIFWQVSMPLARPAIAVSAALVAMETLADFATVNYFAVNTLTTAVYDTWLNYGSLTAAAKISVIMLVIVLLLISLERFSRKQQRSYQQQQKHPLKQLSGSANALAFSACFLVLSAGFIVPVAYLLRFAYLYRAQAWNSDFFQFGLNSLSLSFSVALICLVVALVLVVLKRFSQDSHGNRLGSLLPMRLASSGYAMPGTVLAIAVLIPLTVVDHGINHYLRQLGIDPVGLILTGTVFAIGFAYVIRFSAVAIGAIESSYERMPPSLDQASYMLGKNRWQTLSAVHLPLLKRGALVAMLLVFIEAMKELPAALLLRPFNYDTLATYVFQYVSDEQLELASMAAISIIIAGLVPIILLNRSMEQQ
ncbi:ABC transporter permease [Thalassotalea maritima]|uniref:ABC transporter permease n=1 Tax=Thalassotalea maritima TaxID=3242416 RepID=UPI003529BC3D